MYEIKTIPILQFIFTTIPDVEASLAVEGCTYYRHNNVGHNFHEIFGFVEYFIGNSTVLDAEEQDYFIALK